MRTLLVRCDVCSIVTPHIAIADQQEFDADGRKYERIQCKTCGTHKKLYPDEDPDFPDKK